MNRSDDVRTVIDGVHQERPNARLQVPAGLQLRLFERESGLMVPDRIIRVRGGFVDAMGIQ
jgi:hypothetical protein